MWVVRLGGSMLRPRIQGPYEGCRGGLHTAPMRIFVLENPGRVEEFARAYAHYVGASTMRALCGELKDLLEVEDHE
jgi:hypothetical protein